ncbi:LytTR family DNA-binding domain-containing protein [Paenibacillus turpanensis]|uniref:LytTR family DNA-binding domain-containing protein n=1 Tax=Paenibacillus turpanensis TaxID=2689078 RepID=UPI0014079895|nr:LytTR family DNA-binding domain-containing protein [Paenibacillus turpanensis]
MTVLKLGNHGANTVECIDLEDVDYIEIEGRKIIFHAKDEKYQHISTLSELEEHLFKHGFDLLDKTNLVNLKRVKHYDESQGKVFFEEQPTAKSKYATVALIKQKQIRRYLGQPLVKESRESLPAVLGLLHKDELKKRLIADYSG